MRETGDGIQPRDRLIVVAVPGGSAFEIGAEPGRCELAAPHSM